MQHIGIDTKQSIVTRNGFLVRQRVGRGDPHLLGARGALTTPTAIPKIF